MFLSTSSGAMLTTPLMDVRNVMWWFHNTDLFVLKNIEHLRRWYLKPNFIFIRLLHTTLWAYGAPGTDLAVTNNNLTRLLGSYQKMPVFSTVGKHSVSSPRFLLRVNVPITTKSGFMNRLDYLTSESLTRVLKYLFLGTLRAEKYVGRLWQYVSRF